MSGWPPGPWRRRDSAPVSFSCNICDSHHEVRRRDIRREVISCSACGSTLRWRAMIAALTVELFGASRPISAIDERAGLRGLGTSDWEGYAQRLARVCEYRNTFYDRRPFLDLSAPPPAELVGSFDFVLSSDVLEHVPPPYERALEHLRALLRPGGVLVLSVPTTLSGPVVEHFPELADYEIVERDGAAVLVNHTRDGRRQVFEDLCFHGGEGSTLEMRVFSGPALLEGLGATGFIDPRAFDREVPEHGVVWQQRWSWPVTARAPR